MIEINTELANKIVTDMLLAQDFIEEITKIENYVSDGGMISYYIYSNQYIKDKKYQKIIPVKYEEYFELLKQALKNQGYYVDEIIPTIKDREVIYNVNIANLNSNHR